MFALILSSPLGQVQCVCVGVTLLFSSIPVTLTVCSTLVYPFDVRFVVPMTMVVFDEFRCVLLLL
jgi:hypothetical protein